MKILSTPSPLDEIDVLIQKYHVKEIMDDTGTFPAGEWLEALSKSYFSITGVSNIQLIVFGLIMISIMLFEPLGIFGIWIRAKKYWKTWPF